MKQPLEKHEVKYPVNCGFCNHMSYIIVDCQKVLESLPIIKIAKTALKDIKEHDQYCGVSSCGHKSIDIMASNALDLIESIEAGSEPVEK